MEVYAPPQNKLFALKSSNPAYWSLLLTRSEYGESEIEQALTSIDEVNAELCNLLSLAYDLLMWEDGEEMNYIWGFASDTHAKLSEMLAQTAYYFPSFSDNSHLNCFPVRKWQKEVAVLRKQMDKIRKIMVTL